MKIHAAANPPPPDAGDEIDVERGAVTFDPWPFRTNPVELDIGVTFIDAYGSALADDGPYFLHIRDARTLAHLRDGRQVLLHESTWDAAVAKHEGR